MERETGIEPATSSLGSWRSTAELLPLRATEKLVYHRDKFGSKTRGMPRHPVIPATAAREEFDDHAQLRDQGL
jgi:hypothetical protein